MALSSHLMSDPGWEVDEDDAQALADEIVSQLARGVDVAYRLLSVAAANVASVPDDACADGAQHPLLPRRPDVQVVYDPLGLLDQISSPEAADLILDLLERAPNRAMYLHAIWLATQMMVPRQLRRPAAGPARRAGAGPVAGRPREGARGTSPS